MMPRRLRTATLAPVALLLALAAGRNPSAAQEPPYPAARGLFRTGGAASQGAPNRPWVARSRVVSVDLETWAAALPGGPGSGRPSLLLNLFDDASFPAVFDRIDAASNGLTWVGRVPDRPLSTVTLTLVDGVMAGSVIMPGSVYAIRYAGGGLHEVSEVDQSQYPAEARPVPYPAAPPPREPVDADPAARADSGSLIDVMVLYTPAATTSAGGPSAIASRINLAVSETNTSYGNSGINQRVRLVHSEQVEYTENNDLGIDLDNVTNHNGSSPISTPLGNAAAALRNLHGADLVVLVTSPPSPQYCGIAWMMNSVSSGFAPFGFSVVDEGCLSPNGAFGHELGHNMGARHDWYMDNSTTPHTYAHGYVNTAARWRTVMSYNNLCSAQSFNCTRLLYWSNPGVLYSGAPMGIPGGTKSNCPESDISNVSCDADDHRTLNETATTVANFRASVLRPVSDFTADQKSDILWHHATRGEVWLWPMNGPAKTAESLVRTVGDTGWEIRGLGDQTGDGRADVLWRHATTGALYLWTMNGSAVAAEAYVGTVDTAYDVAGTGDYDGDGRSDILWRHAASGQLWVWLMNGAAAHSVSYVDTVDLGYEVVGSGDLDGDRKADIVWRHAGAGDIWVWLMNGAARRSATYVATVPDPGYQVVGAADYTGDGRADILWRHSTRGEIWLWTMEGAVAVSQSYAGTVADTGYRITGTGDYDGDGRADILWHHNSRGDVWEWKMNGAAKQSESYVATVPDVGYRIVRAK